MLRINDINYKINSTDILKNISFEINKGDCFALIGQNGSGKSTLIDIITNSLNPNSGNVLINNLKFNEVKNKVGVIFDDILLPNILKVREIIDYVSIIRKIEKSNYLKIFDRLKISEIYNKKIYVLSKGEYKRLLIFLSIFHKPDLLIMDEATSVLDPEFRKNCWEILKETVPTILFTTHLWEEVEEYSNKVAFIYNGKLLIEPCSLKKLFVSINFPKTKLTINKIYLDKIKNILTQIFFKYTIEHNINICDDNHEKLFTFLNANNIKYNVSSTNIFDLYQFIKNKND